MVKVVVLILMIAGFITSGCNNNDQKQAVNVNNSKRKDPAKLTITRTILFFGNSLTAGYGLDVSEAFPALLQARIDSLNLPYKVINAGLSGETSAGGKNSIGWLLRQKVDIFVLELGAIDGLRGIAVEVK